MWEGIPKDLLERITPHAATTSSRRIARSDNLVAPSRRAQPFEWGNLVIDDANAYWMDKGGSGVMKVSKTGGTPELLASIPPPCLEGRRIAVDSGFVYFTAYWPRAPLDNPDICPVALPTVLKVPVTGGASQVLSSRDSAGTPRALAVGPTHVYFADNTNCSLGATIKRITK